MSATTSAATGRCFGIQRVCQVWERSRSALYARRARAHHRLGAVSARRGPPPRQSDAQLLAAIRADLARCQRSFKFPPPAVIENSPTPGL